MIDDRALLNSIAQREEWAFKELFERYKDRVYNAVLHIVQQVEDAEEITQDVFVEIHRGASSFKGDAAVGTWVYRIATNRSLDRLRQRQRKKHGIIAFFFGEVPENADNHTMEHPAANGDDAALYHEIQGLPERQRIAVVLTYLEGLPQREVAAAMSVNLKALESLLSRAKVTLRGKLRPAKERAMNDV
jgi:RNA polymerase sigma-70 factor (ECF subfamily)